MTDIREYLAHKPLLFDGGMGTYYKAAPGADCEMANLTDPEGVKKVHAEYLAAGAQAIKTNTFGLPRMAAAQMPGWEELAEAGWKLACVSSFILASVSAVPSQWQRKKPPSLIFSLNSS